MNKIDAIIGGSPGIGFGRKDCSKSSLIPFCPPPPPAAKRRTCFRARKPQAAKNRDAVLRNDAKRTQNPLRDQAVE